MTILAADLGSLVQVVFVSLGAGVGVTVVYSLAVLGAIRSTDSRRERRRRMSLAWGLLALVATIGVLAAVGAGLRVIAG